VAIKQLESEKAIVGKAYKELKKLVKQYAINDKPIILFGETGSGKELFAKLFMEECKKKGKRKGEQRSINCAAFIDEMLRSEIFGHVKGAFTNAINTRKGLFPVCNDGILFLDELGSASKEFQAAILRVAERNSYSPVGSDKEEISNTLIIAATSNLSDIRDDLKRRFHIIPIPPLQSFDIAEIAKHHLNRSLKEEVLAELKAQEFPGNVRQLLKRCDQLDIEKGGEVFCKKPDSKKETILFDYQRFRREIKIWNKYIQPLINEHGPKNLKHKYMEFGSNRIDYDGTLMIREQLVHGPQVLYDKRHAKKQKQIYLHGTLELIEWLRNESHKEKELPSAQRLILKKYDHVQWDTIPDLPKFLEKKASDIEAISENASKLVKPEISPKDVPIFFKKHMRKYFDEGLLPYLLEQLDIRYNPAAEPPTAVIKPSLSALLDFPLREAESTFKRLYLTYQRDRFSGNDEEAANLSGLSRRAFQQRLRRSLNNQE